MDSSAAQRRLRAISGHLRPAGDLDHRSQLGTNATAGEFVFGTLSHALALIFLTFVFVYIFLAFAVLFNGGHEFFVGHLDVPQIESNICFDIFIGSLKSSKILKLVMDFVVVLPFFPRPLSNRISKTRICGVKAASITKEPVLLRLLIHVFFSDRLICLFF